MLSPLKFTPIFRESIWGGRKLEKFGKNLPKCGNIGESWEVSTIEDIENEVCCGPFEGNTLSELTEVYMEELLGDSVFQKFGTEFPLLVKMIDASGKLSIQVHPDDKLAEERHHAYGKSEMWYILSCEEGAYIYLGFNKRVTKEEYEKHVENSTIEQILNKIEVKKGDVYYVPSGVIHTIGEGIVIIEIQQASDITYRIYDWDRVDEDGEYRDTHTQLALDAIKFGNRFDSDNCITPVFKENEVVKLHKCEYFTSNVIEISGELVRDLAPIDSFAIYIAIDGDMTIDYPEGSIDILLGESVVIPAIINDVTLRGKGKVIEVYVECE